MYKFNGGAYVFWWVSNDIFIKNWDSSNTISRKKLETPIAMHNPSSP